MQKIKGLLVLIITVSLMITLLPITALAAVGDTLITNSIQYRLLTEAETTGTVEVIANNYSVTSIDTGLFCGQRLLVHIQNVIFLV